MSNRIGILAFGEIPNFIFDMVYNGDNVEKVAIGGYGTIVDMFATNGAL